MIPVCFDLPNDRIGLSTRPIVQYIQLHIIHHVIHRSCTLIFYLLVCIVMVYVVSYMFAAFRFRQTTKIKGYILLHSGFSRTDFVSVYIDTHYSTPHLSCM